MNAVQGQQVTDNFTIRVSDGAGGVTDRPVSITINGANDAANIGNANVTDVTEDTNVNGAGNSAALQYCASDATKYFALTTTSGVVTTFKQIAQQITNVRVVK